MLLEGIGVTALLKQALVQAACGNPQSPLALPTYGQASRLHWAIRIDALLPSDPREVTL